MSNRPPDSLMYAFADHDPLAEIGGTPIAYYRRWLAGHRVLTLSAGHFTRGDLRMMRSADRLWPVTATGDSVFICVDRVELDEEQELRRRGWSDAFVRLLYLARVLGHHYIEVHDEEVPLPFLPTMSEEVPDLEDREANEEDDDGR